MKYLVAKLPMGEGHGVAYMCRGDNWSTHPHHAAHMSFAEAVADRLRRTPGLTEAGVQSVIVIDSPFD
jgi:hypothetical protein